MKTRPRFRRGEGFSVRFVDRGSVRGFVADLELDVDDLIQVYPELAQRVG
jgi:hypothetical protein